MIDHDVHIGAPLSSMRLLMYSSVRSFTSG